MTEPNMQVQRVEMNLVPAGEDTPDNRPRQLTPAAALFLKECKGKREVEQKIPFIRIDHKTAQFVLPDGEVVEEIGGYPLFVFRNRRFYKRPPKSGERGQPPDCWSDDRVSPHPSSKEKQSEFCGNCPQNDWASARDGRSKACAEFAWIFLLNARFGRVPLGILTLPPSSLRVLFGTHRQQGYFDVADARHGAFEIVWTKFRLHPEGDGSMPYCTIVPIMGMPQLDVEKVDRLVQIQKRFFSVVEEYRSQRLDTASADDEG